MNYIQQLEVSLSEERKKNAFLNARIQELRVHIFSPKFQGELNNQINTKDIDNWINYILEDCRASTPKINFELLKEVSDFIRNCYFTDSKAPKESRDLYQKMDKHIKELKGLIL